MGKVKKTPGKVNVGPYDGLDSRSFMRPTPCRWFCRECLFDKPLLKLAKRFTRRSDLSKVCGYGMIIQLLYMWVGYGRPNSFCAKSYDHFN